MYTDNARHGLWVVNTIAGEVDTNGVTKLCIHVTMLVRVVVYRRFNLSVRTGRAVVKSE